MTSHANWLRLIARKGFTDATALGEINTGGTGTLGPAAESIEALANAVGTPAQAATVAAAIAGLGTPAQAGIFTGLTRLANWLRLIARKGFVPATALGEINTGGTGALDPAAESIEALAAAIAGVGGGGGGGGADPLTNTVPGTYPPGSAGAALGRIGTATINIASPIAANGDLELIAADDYFAADGRALDFSNPAGTWPNLTGAALPWSPPKTVRK